MGRCRREPAEKWLSLEELAKQLNVSTRTIRRWRKLGLVGRRLVRGGKRQVCYVQSVVDRFLAGHQRASGTRRQVLADE